MKILKIFLSLVIISVIGFGSYHGLFLSDLTKIKEITIVGANPNLEKELQKMHGIVPGTSFWKTDVDQLAAKLKKHAWVENIEIKKNFPNEITVQVTERKPKALLNKGQGKFDYIDDSGFVFGPAKPIDASEKVVLSGKSLIEKSELREAAIEVVKQFPPSGAMSLSDVSEIQFNNEKGYQVVLSKTGMIVDLGKENLPVRVDRARRVVQYLESHQINASHIDADYAKKVLVKVRKDR
nr:POTRA domain, FtsQ-type [uncultured bacterium]AIA18456.1 POTRA domain, FtsQ-type [uncultured bacterium]